MIWHIEKGRCHHYVVRMCELEEQSSMAWQNVTTVICVAWIVIVDVVGAQRSECEQ